MSDVIHASGAPSKRRSPLETGFTSLRFGPEHGVLEMAKQLQAAMDEDGVDLRIVDMSAGGDIDREVFSEIVYAETFVVLGSKHYGQDTGNQASTFYESKFARGKKKRIILIRMIPFDEEFVELQAQILFGMNNLELYWEVGTPMPPELPVQIMEGMGLPKEKITAAKANAKRRVAAQERAKQEASAQQAEHKAGPPGREATSAWEIAEKIGRGGSNSVLRVRERATGKEAAAKVHSDVRAFKKEWQTLRRIADFRSGDSVHRDFVVQLLGVEEHASAGPTLYLELAAGSLRDVIEAEPGGLDATDARSLASQILKILDYLHEVIGMAHCDVKADNLLVFGISRKLKVCDLDSATAFGEPRGLKATAYTCAPELAKHITTGGKASLKVHRAEDIWAFGVTVLYLLMGRHPFPGSQSDSAAEKYGPYARITPEQVRQAIRQPRAASGQLQSFLSACLRVEPDERPTAASLLQAGWISGNTNTEYIRMTGGRIDEIRDHQRVHSQKLDNLQSSVEVVQQTQEEILQSLRDQFGQLSQISAATSATFQVAKSIAEGDVDIPRLVTIAPVDSPEWSGRDSVSNNLSRKLQNAVGAKAYFRLQFLCEKTLVPAVGHTGYVFGLPTKELADFLNKAAPIISATVGVLKLVTFVARPLLKVTGIDVPPINLEEIGNLQCGEATVAEVFEGSSIESLLSNSTAGHTTSYGEPPLLHFAESAVGAIEELAQSAHVELQEDATGSTPTEQKSRVAIDELRQWIENAGKAEDLERHIIGGLRKTVMRDGRVMWLSAAAAAEWDSVSPEQPVVFVEEPEDFKGTNIIDESTELESAQLLGNDSSRSTEVAEMFERFDADGNGFLSQAECRAAATALFPDEDWEAELWPALCEAYGADPAKGMDVTQFGSFVQQAEKANAGATRTTVTDESAQLLGGSSSSSKSSNAERQVAPGNSKMRKYVCGVALAVMLLIVVLVSSGGCDVSCSCSAGPLTKCDLSSTSVSGSVEPLAALTQLTYLDLGYTSVSGSVEPLAALTQLETLSLYATSVSGSVEPLAALTHLETLWLSSTSVSGSVEPLAALTQLTYLDLYSTSVSGSVEPLAALTQLETLSLDATSVSGSVEPLAALTQLKHLDLSSTSVSGSVAPLAALTQLTYLNLYGTSVLGSVEPLAALTQLTYFSLDSTSVTGSCDSLSVCQEEHVYCQC